MNCVIQLHPLVLEESFLEAMACVYEEALNLKWEDEFPGVLAYVDRFPDFHGVLASVESEVVGVGWGTRTQPGEWLYDRVVAQIGSDHAVLQDTWLLNVLAVLEAHRGKGIGGLLLDAVMQMQPCSHALVCTPVANTAARRLYEHRGWHYFHPECIVQAGERQMVVLYQERGWLKEAPVER